MLNEDDPPRPSTQLVAAPPLDRLSVGELESYIAGLRAEIGRAEAEIARKQAVARAAHTFFRAPDQ